MGSNLTSRGAGARILNLGREPAAEFLGRKFARCQENHGGMRKTRARYPMKATHTVTAEELQTAHDQPVLKSELINQPAGGIAAYTRVQLAKQARGTP